MYRYISLKTKQPLILEKCYSKGTVSVISSNPSCKDCNARFTMVPLNLNYISKIIVMKTYYFQ